MNLRSWTIATIRGVSLNLHISLLFLLFYVVLVATAQFPMVVQQSGVNSETITGSPLLWGWIFALSLLVSVTLHEFGHVLVAQNLGAKVRSITLMAIGGMSQLEHMPEKRYDEFKIAVVGPIVSLGLAAILFFVKVQTGSGNISFFSHWLGQVNLVLGIFNLIPAFPTDGGRILRSVLAARRGRIQGTKTAVQVSQTLAAVMGLIAFLQFNLVLLLIAFFIYASAKSEFFILMSENILKGFRANEVGVRMDPVSGDASLDEAAALMLRSRSLFIPVQVGPRIPSVAGIIGIDQLRTIPRDRWHAVRVSDVMLSVSKPVETLEKVEEFFGRVFSAPGGGLPMTEEGRVVGIIRNTDLTNAIQFKALSPSEDAAIDDRRRVG